MSLPLVAIVGRPNVGKSTLFNRLVGGRVAIVEDSPGVTRDRLYGEAEWFGRRFAVVDTGGYEPMAGDPIMVGVRAQAELAMQEAEIICLVVDGRTGLTPDDSELTAVIRRSGRPLVLAVNKVDGASQEPHAAEFHALGLADLMPVSAAHGRGVSDLVDRIIELLPEAEEDETPDGWETRVAFIGRPNVGKSTLVNRLLGRERSLVADQPGTTRDPVDSEMVVDGRRYRLIDTAGIRRKSKIRLDLERYTVVRAFRAIDRSHVVCFLLDARTGVADQDSRIAAYARRRGRASVVILNKWDALEERTQRTQDTMVRQLREQFNFLPYAPVLTMSALTGQRVGRLLKTIDAVREQHLLRLPTGPLNRVFQRIAEAHHPPLFRGRPVRFYYITQGRVSPPTFIISCNQPAGVPETYKRYIENRLREAYPFTGTPVRIEFTKRGAETPRKPAPAPKGRRAPAQGRRAQAQSRRDSRSGRRGRRGE